MKKKKFRKCCYVGSLQSVFITIVTYDPGDIQTWPKDTSYDLRRSDHSTIASRKTKAHE